MIIIIGIFIESLVRKNDAPMEVYSNMSIGNFVVDHAPTKIKMLKNFTPFFIKDEATGNTT